MYYFENVGEDDYCIIYLENKRYYYLDAHNITYIGATYGFELILYLNMNIRETIFFDEYRGAYRLPMYKKNSNISLPCNLKYPFH